MLFPQRVEDYISKDDPVRVYDAFVEALDWDSLNTICDRKKRGCPQYDPKAMLKVLVYFRNAASSSASSSTETFLVLKSPETTR